MSDERDETLDAAVNADMGNFAHAVTTGYPPVDLLACSVCGVLLWDVSLHHRWTHPNRLAAMGL